jgi:DNA-binding NtrC family response regulator
VSEADQDSKALIDELLGMVDEFLKHMAELEAENQDLRQQLVSSGSEPKITGPEPVPVLIVDPEESRARSLGEMLERCGCRVSRVPTTTEALERLGAEEFNLVFVESQVGGDNGLGIIQQVKEAAPEADCLIVVGFTSADKAVQALRMGATDFFIRPVQEEDLLTRVGEILQRQRIEQRSRRYLADLRDRYQKIVDQYRG